MIFDKKTGNKTKDDGGRRRMGGGEGSSRMCIVDLGRKNDENKENKEKTSQPTTEKSNRIKSKEMRRLQESRTEMNPNRIKEIYIYIYICLCFSVSMCVCVCVCV